MKVFVEAKGESIVINGEIIVTVMDVVDENVVLAVDAPEWIEVGEQAMSVESEAVSVRPR